MLAADTAPERILALAGPAPDGLQFDERADGALWVRGDSYKASFTARAVTIVPFFGSDAPRNYPIEFRASAVTLAGETLPTGAPARAVRSDRTVTIDRASFIEEYVLEEEQLEQRFVFDTLPRRGELALRIDVATELSALDLGETLRFSNELGHVDYGAAFALDAHGARIALERTFQDGAIRLTVPSAFVANAVLPLTIDPFVTVFTVSQGTLVKINPDVSYDASSNRWCVVYEDVFSADDHDVTAKLFDLNALLVAIHTIDATSDYWTTPRIANNDNASIFLIVGAVDMAPVASNKATIFGRIITVFGGTLGPVLLISPNDTTDRDMPDVGGDAWNGSSSLFCVVWQHYLSPGNDISIEMQMVRQSGIREGGVVTVGSGGRNTLPAISSSNGLVSTNGPSAERWTVTWQFESSPTDRDIFARQVAWNGVLLSPEITVGATPDDETEPSVASVLDPIAGERYGLIVYQRADGGDEDIIGVLLRGPTVVDIRNLSADLPTTAASRQLSPQADSDGRHFLVGYLESGASPGFLTTYASDYFVSGGLLVPWSRHHSFGNLTNSQSDFALHSRYSSGGSRERYIGAWSLPGLSTIQGTLFDGGSGGAVSVVCTGDGAGTACPCGNSGGIGLGCANSETGGGRLTSVNAPSVSADVFVLRGSGMTAFSTCLYFQGSALNASGAGFVFGDGKLCAAGTVIRLGIKANSNGASEFPGLGDPSVSALGLIPVEGATRFYQVWYRDSAAFCTNLTFNLTNALQVAWAP